MLRSGGRVARLSRLTRQVRHDNPRHISYPYSYRQPRPAIMPEQPELPHPPHVDHDSALAKKFGRETTNYFGSEFNAKGPEDQMLTITRFTSEPTLVLARGP